MLSIYPNSRRALPLFCVLLLFGCLEPFQFLAVALLSAILSTARSFVSNSRATILTVLLFALGSVVPPSGQLGLRLLKMLVPDFTFFDACSGCSDEALWGQLYGAAFLYTAVWSVFLFALRRLALNWTNLKPQSLASQLRSGEDLVGQFKARSGKRPGRCAALAQNHPAPGAGGAGPRAASVPSHP